jgi:hypothetical protein
MLSNVQWKVVAVMAAGAQLPRVRVLNNECDEGVVGWLEGRSGQSKVRAREAELLELEYESLMA